MKMKYSKTTPTTTNLNPYKVREWMEKHKNKR